jgi:hypothetical protein
VEFTSVSCDPVTLVRVARLEALDQIGGDFLPWDAGEDSNWDIGVELC